MKTNKINILKGISIFLVGIFLINLVNVRLVFAAEGSLLSVSRTLGASTVKVGDTFDVNYRISPKPITIPQDNKVKDIVLVVDTSLSMDYGLNSNTAAAAGASRLDSVKRVAANFVSKFNDANVNIALVKFHGYASNVVALSNTADSTRRNSLINSINALNTRNSNGTNIGDGIRDAFYLLGNSTHDRYVIVLTDGESNYYSYTSSGKNTYYYTGSGTYQNYYYDVTGSNGDPNGYSLAYAKLVGSSLVAPTTIRSYVVGFGPETMSNNLAIATSANGTYVKASNETELNNMYNKFYSNINNPNANLYFEDNVPNGVEYVTSRVSDQVSILDNSNGKISGNLTVSYRRDAYNTSQYIADPIDIKVTYRVKATGTTQYQASGIAFPGNQGYAKLTPSNFSLQSETLYFDTTSNVTVSGLSAPVITPDSTQPTSSNVNVAIAYDSNAVTREYSTDNTTWISYTAPVVFTSNGKIYAREMDAWNRSYITGPVNITNIDKTLPLASITYSTTSPTNGNVVVTLVPSKAVTVTNNNGSSQYTFTENGSFTFQFRDAAGNVGSATATVSNIDKKVPTATIDYSNLNPTNMEVTATLKPSENVTIINNSGASTYTFTSNGSFTFQFRDAAGNTGSATATVSNIDKIAPTGNITYSTTTLTNGDVTVTLVPSEEVIIDNNNGLKQYVFTQNGSFTFQFRDLAGNAGSATATVNNIDKAALSANISYSTTALTNGNVIATLVPSKSVTITNNNGSSTYTFTQNGSFTFQFRDALGSIGTATATVTNIDKIAPAAPSIGNASQTINADNITITGTAEPSSTVEIFVSGVSVGTVLANAMDGSFSKVVNLVQNANNVITARATDSVGNVGPAAAGVIITEDSNPPAAPVILTQSQIINADSISITGSAEGNSNVEVFVDGMSIGFVKAASNGSFAKTINLNQNANNVITAKATDAVGNTGAVSEAVTITEDSNSPGVPVILTPSQIINANSINITGSAEDNSNVEIFVNGVSVGIVKAALDGSFSKIVSLTQNAGNIITARAVDAAGNVGGMSGSITITEDSNPPAAPVISTPSQTINSSSITITGKAEGGATVELFVNGTSIGTVKSASDGSFSKVVSLIQNAENLITAKAVDQASNISPLSSEVNITEDSNPPSAPVISTKSQSTVENSIVIAGTAEANSTVEIFVNGASVGTVKAGTDGKFSKTVALELDDANTITARAKDGAGNVGTVSGQIIITQINLAVPKISLSVDSIKDTNKLLTVKFSGSYTVQYRINNSQTWTTLDGDVKQFAVGTVVYARQTDGNGHYSDESKGFTVNNILSVSSINSIVKGKTASVTVKVSNWSNKLVEVSCDSKYISVKSNGVDQNGNPIFILTGNNASGGNVLITFRLKDNSNISVTISVKVLPKTGKGIM